MGAGIIQTKALQVGCLLRLEPNAQAQVSGGAGGLPYTDESALPCVPSAPHMPGPLGSFLQVPLLQGPVPFRALHPLAFLPSFFLHVFSTVLGLLSSILYLLGLLCCCYSCLLFLLSACRFFSPFPVFFYLPCTLPPGSPSPVSSLSRPPRVPHPDVPADPAHQQGARLPSPV